MLIPQHNFYCISLPPTVEELLFYICLKEEKWKQQCLLKRSVPFQTRTKSGECCDLSHTRQLMESFLHDARPVCRIQLSKQYLGVTGNLCHLAHRQLRREGWFLAGWPLGVSMSLSGQPKRCLPTPSRLKGTLVCQHAKTLIVFLVLLPEEAHVQDLGSVWDLLRFCREVSPSAGKYVTILL